MDSNHNFKKLLDQHHEWPARYTFKFVVPHTQVEAVKAILPPGVTTSRISRTGKYISLTAILLVDSADAVVRIYERAAKIEGIICL